MIYNTPPQRVDDVIVVRLLHGGLVPSTHPVGFKPKTESAAPDGNIFVQGTNTILHYHKANSMCGRQCHAMGNHNSPEIRSKQFLFISGNVGMSFKDLYGRNKKMYAKVSTRSFPVLVCIPPWILYCITAGDTGAYYLGSDDESDLISEIDFNKKSEEIAAQLRRDELINRAR